MDQTLSDLNKKRRESYRKDTDLEDFLLRMNKNLQLLELPNYRNFEIEHPFIFIIGLPRSGTTLMSQFLAYSFDVGFINNLISRFWLAPIHGIRLSRSILGNTKKIDFESDYARTVNMSDIHEFGYFWRYWLQKETFQDVANAKSREKYIQWSDLRKVLSSIQHEFNKPMVFKNIFGSYHMTRIRDLLEKVIYVYIERDFLDVAVSILEARKKYYENLNNWWSYQPIEYDLIKGLDYWHQIAGQIYFLKRYYHKQFSECGQQYVIRISYETFCKDPARVLEMIQQRSQMVFKSEIKIIHPPTKSFPFRVYSDREEEKKKFKQLIEEYQEKYGKF